MEEWAELDLEPIDSPEDWAGPLGDINPEDLGYE